MADEEDPCALSFATNSKNSDDPKEYDYDTLPPFPPVIRPSGTGIRAKEVILVSLALLLLICSVLLFFKHWKKNYRDINQLPYYAYLYQKEEAEFLPPPPPPPPPIGEDLWSTGAPSAAHLLHKNSLQTVDGFHVAPPDSVDSQEDLNSPRLPRSNSLRGHCRLSSLVATTSRLNSTSVLPSGQQRKLNRIKTEPMVFPGMLRRSIDRPILAAAAVKPPPQAVVPRPRPHLPPKRAASDVYVRFQHCRFDMMRRIQSGLEVPEETTSDSGGEKSSVSSDQGIKMERVKAESSPEEEEEDKQDLFDVSKKNKNSVQVETVVRCSPEFSASGSISTDV